MKIAQDLLGAGGGPAAGTVPPPDAGGGTLPTAGPAGAPPMGGSEGGEGAPPASTFKIIYSPLDSLGKILADLDFKTYVENNFGDDSTALAHKIWVMYGGPESELGRGKPGKRQDRPQSSDPAELERLNTEEYNNTRDRRWERLPLGVSIDEITNPQALQMTVEGGFNALVKQNSKPAAAWANGWLKIAEKADSLGLYSYVDDLQVLIKDVYTL